MALRKKEKKAAFLFLAPSLVLYLLYVILPIFHTGYISLTDWDGITGNPLPICVTAPSFSCFENYIELFEDDVFWTSLKNNIIWLFFFSLSPFLGLGLALFFHVKSPVTTIYKSLIFMPMVLSLVVVGLVWGWFLQPEFGLVEFLLKKFNLLDLDSQMTIMASFTWATAGLIIAASWPHAAYCMILYLAGLSNLKKNVLEAAAIDGAQGFRMFWHIVLPMLKPATVIVVIVTMIGALRTFELVSIMTDGGPANSSNVLANYMYQQTFRSFRYGYGAAIAIVLFFSSLVLIVGYLRQTQKTEF